MLGALSVLLAYLLGAMPFGYLLVRWRRGEDVRAYGSGSTGATNVTRRAGPLVGVLTLVLDAAKGYLAMVVCASLTVGDVRWLAGAAVATLLGHSYPVFLGFHGGKSVATALGVFFFLAPLAVAAALGVWVVVFAAWRYVALASLLAAGAYPLLAFALYRPPLATTVATVACASLIIFRHRENLERLVAGAEPRFRLERKR